MDNKIFWIFFHHKAITRDWGVINNYKKEVVEGMDWLNKGWVDWSNDLILPGKVIGKRKKPV